MTIKSKIKNLTTPAITVLSILIGFISAIFYKIFLNVWNTQGDCKDGLYPASGSLVDCERLGLFDIKLPEFFQLTQYGNAIDFSIIITILFTLIAAFSLLVMKIK